VISRDEQNETARSSLRLDQVPIARHTMLAGQWRTYGAGIRPS